MQHLQDKRVLVVQASMDMVQIQLETVGSQLEQEQDMKDMQVHRQVGMVLEAVKLVDNQGSGVVEVQVADLVLVVERVEAELVDIQEY